MSLKLANTNQVGHAYTMVIYTMGVFGGGGVFSLVGDLCIANRTSYCLILLPSIFKRSWLFFLRIITLESIIAKQDWPLRQLSR